MFKNGDLVLYKIHSSKSFYKWGKGIIEKKIGKVLYLVKDVETSSFTKKMSIK